MGACSPTILYVVLVIHNNRVSLKIIYYFQVKTNQNHDLILVVEMYPKIYMWQHINFNCLLVL